MWFRFDPGPCPICSTRHCACTSPDYKPPSTKSATIVDTTTTPPSETFTTTSRGLPKRGSAMKGSTT